MATESVARKNEQSRLELPPMELLIEDMKNSDINIRVNVMKNLSIIAKNLGPEKFTSELLPFLSQKVNDEDEVFYQMAIQVASFPQYIGAEENISTLMPLLDLLLSMEESYVRKQAVESYKNIVQCLSPATIENIIFPKFLNLFSAVWFTKKVSGCALLEFMMNLISNENKIKLFESSIGLSLDEMPFVRKSHIASMSGCLKTIHSANIALSEAEKKDYEDNFSNLITTESAYFTYTKFFPTINQVIGDEEDTIKIVILEELAPICRALVPEFNAEGQRTLLFPALEKLMSERSWKVRAISCHLLPEFLETFDSDVLEDFAIKKFVDYLDDIENEVKVRATSNIGNFVEALQESDRKEFIISKLVPKIDILIKSNNTYIKSSLSKSIVKLSKYLNNIEISENLLPNFLDLLRDSDSNISLEMINQICEQSSESFSMSELSTSIFDSITELIKDEKWRIREQVIKILPNLLRSTGYESEECRQLLATTLTMLVDSVHAVRRTTVAALGAMAVLQGMAWTAQQVLPNVLYLQSTPNHLHRQIYVDLLETISSHMQLEEILEVYEQTKTMINDPVPNVRFRIIQFYHECLFTKLSQTDEAKNNPNCQKTVDEIVENCKRLLEEDKDPDVQDFAHAFLESINRL